MNPMMTPKEQEFFAQILNRKPNQAYLEYGAGGSTVWACNCNNIQSVTSVEVDKDWIENIKKQDLRIKPQFFNPGYSHKGLSVPINNTEKDKWELFSSGINGLFDVVLVDGRFRVACAAYAYDLLKEDGVMLIHDYKEDRLEYYNIEKLYNILHKVDALISVKKITGTDNKQLWREFKHSWL